MDVLSLAGLWLLASLVALVAFAALLSGAERGARAAGSAQD